MKEIELITERDQIMSVAARWKKHFYTRHHGSGTYLWGHVFGNKSSEEIYNRLVALDKTTATAEDVDAIIGTTGEVSFFCHICETVKTTYIQFADSEDDHDSIEICCDCIQKAAKIAKGPHD